MSVDGTSTPITKWIANRLKASSLTTGEFAEFFSPSTLLVPVPKSSLMTKGMLWVPMQMAEALADTGLGRLTPLLHRTKAIPKAATSVSFERPKAKNHFQTLGVKSDIGFSSDCAQDVLLVDDVITTGAAMLGSASRINASFPKCRVKGFAGVRTVSVPSKYTRFVDPQLGKITLGSDGRTTSVVSPKRLRL